MVKMETIYRCNLDREIAATKGKIFALGFVKANGDYRRMVCRTGVKKGVKGTGKPDDLSKLPYRRVYDMQKHAFRRINLATTLWIRTHGVTKQVINTGGPYDPK